MGLCSMKIIACDLGNLVNKHNGLRSSDTGFYSARQCERNKITVCRVAGHKEDVHVGTWRQLCQGGELIRAVEALDLLVQRSLYVDNYVFYGILKRCISEKNLLLGSHVHALVVRSGYASDAFLANHIICMYASHGRLKDAMLVFTKVPAPSRYMWASIILAHARHGQPRQAIKLYIKMMQESTAKPDNHIFVAVLTACASSEDLLSGRKVHADILATAGLSNIFVANCLVTMYSKCGNLEEAHNVFNNLPKKNVVTWNALLAGYAQNGHGKAALALYDNMQREGIILADAVTFVSLLHACACLGTLQEGTKLHAQLIKRGFEADVVVGNSLINMYTKCGSLGDARLVFDNLPTKDVVTWNSMIAGYAQHGFGTEALIIYESMQQQGITPADPVTFVCLLQACASVGGLHHGKQLHAEIQQRGLQYDMIVGTCLVDMYGKCGSLEDARKVFDNLPTRDVVTWTTMIAAYAQHGLGQEALALYGSMQLEDTIPTDTVTFVCLLQACGCVAALEKGKEIHALLSRIGLEATDLFLANALVDMYGKCGSMVDARQVFDALPTRDTVTWSALIAGYARQGESELVFDLLQSMRQEGIQPNSVTFLSVLTVCSHVGLVEKGQVYFEAMQRDFDISPTVEHYGCIVDLLGRAGQVEKAMEMVTEMPIEAPREVWRCLLGACQKWNKLESGRKVFERAVQLHETDAAAYMLMSNIYAAAKMQQEAHDIQAMRVKARAWKDPGQTCWTDIRGRVHTFVVGDVQHPEEHRIYVKLERLFVGMREPGLINIVVD